MSEQNLTPSEWQGVFRKARSLLDNGWCIDTMATDKYGTPVPYSDERAACFCILGAVGRAQVQPLTVVDRPRQLAEEQVLVERPGEHAGTELALEISG